MLLAALACGPTRSSYAQKLLLKLSNYSGTSTIEDHQEWIQLTSTSFGVTPPARGGSSSPEFSVVRRSDASSPKIAQATATGDSLGTATVHWVILPSQAKPVVLYSVSLTNVVATSWHQTADPEGLVEHLTLKFGKLTIEVPILNAGGIPTGASSATIQPGVAALAPQLVARGEWTLPGNYRLWWPATAGQTYRILSSPTLAGTYSLVRQVSPAETGEVSVDIASPTPQQFFRILQVDAP